MAMQSRTYTAEHVAPSPPFALYDLLTDEEQQPQWRARFEKRAPVHDSEPTTRVMFEDGLVIELAPEGTGTRMSASKTRFAEGFTGRIGLWFTSRRTAESEMLDQLKRISATLEYGGI